MTVRAYVTFEDAENPALAVGDADSFDSPPPGRALADDLAQALQQAGLSASYPVSQWESYGWEFTMNVDGRDVWFMLQSTAWPASEEGSPSDPSGEWLVISDTPRRFLEKLRGLTFEESHQKAVTILASVLAQPRFTNIRWFTKEEFESQGGRGEVPGP